MTKFLLYLLLFLQWSVIGCTNLNILFVVKNFPTISETFVLNQITGLLDRDCNVFIYALRHGDFKVVHKDYYRYGLNERTIYALQDNALNKIKAVPFDVIVCHFGPMGNEGLRLITQLKLKAKLCTFFHGYDMSVFLNLHPNIYNNLFNALDIAFPISNYWKNELINLGCNPSKIIVHHMGIDCNKFYFKPRQLHQQEKIRLITIARLVEKKGIKYAIEALAYVAKEYNNIEYYIVGDGILKENLRDLIFVLNLQEKVKLLGWQPQDKVTELLNTAHILVAPSVTSSGNDKEGIPVAIMEAMAMGLPVISTYHSGIPELVEDGITGFLVQEKNVDELAEKIILLIKNSECWEKMGQLGRQKIEKCFEINTLNENLLNILNNIVGGIEA